MSAGRKGPYIHSKFFLASTVYDMLEEARRLSLGFEEIPLNDETPVTSAELCENEAASLPELAKGVRQKFPSRMIGEAEV